MKIEIEDQKLLYVPLSDLRPKDVFAVGMDTCLCELVTQDAPPLYIVQSVDDSKSTVCALDNGFLNVRHKSLIVTKVKAKLVVLNGSVKKAILKDLNPGDCVRLITVDEANGGNPPSKVSPKDVCIIAKSAKVTAGVVTIMDHDGTLTEYDEHQGVYVVEAKWVIKPITRN